MTQLLNKGANPFTADRDGDTTVDLASELGSEAITAALEGRIEDIRVIHIFFSSTLFSVFTSKNVNGIAYLVFFSFQITMCLKN